MTNLNLAVDHVYLLRYPVALFNSIRLEKAAHAEAEKNPGSPVPSQVQRFEHKELIERNELWIVIVTGEAVLSIGASLCCTLIFARILNKFSFLNSDDIK